jgi:hypothetical protein
MLTFFTDESIVEKGGAEEHRVSIYGGVVLKEATFKDLTQFLYKAKDRYVWPQESEIKWRFKTFWDYLRKTDFVAFTKESNPTGYTALKSDYDRFKREILEEVGKSDAVIVIAIRPNHLVRASEEQRVEYSIAAVARKFEKILTQENEFGVILADELPKEINPSASIDHQYILNLCCRGSKSMPFDRLISIVPTINSTISPIHQINDVVLGAVQYYILEFIRQLKDPSHDMTMAKSLVQLVAKRFHTAAAGRFVINNGVLLYPPRASRYGTAREFLNALEEKLREDFAMI